MKPILIAFLICEQIIRSADGKNTLIGIFDQIKPPRTPLGIPIHVYARMFDVYADITVELQLVEAATNLNHLPSNETPLHVESPGAPVELNAMIGCLFPRYGRYDFRIIVDGAFIGQTPITIIEPLAPGAGAEAES